MSRRALAVAGGLAAIVVLSRVPFATHQLWQWDSVLYARALEQGFHVADTLRETRPHPPGYLFYVAVAALFRLVLRDSDAALVAVSVVASAIAAAALFLFAARLAGLGPALLAAAGFAASPLVWLYGEVAYPYAVLGALSIVLAAAFFAWRGRGARGPIAASVLFGLAAGFRQDLLLLCAPLWLWTIWPSTWRVRRACVAATGLACLTWFVPSALLSGGVGPYLEAVLEQSEGVAVAYSVPQNGVPALWYNLRFTLYALAWGLFGFGVLLAALGLAPILRRARLGVWERRPRARDAFFALWIVPPLAFYVLVHIGEWGYVLSVLPALYALVAVLLPSLARQLHGRARRAGRVAAAGLVAAGAVAFLAAPEARFSADALADHDRGIASRVAYVRANFSPDTTLVLAREDFLLVRYYLADYHAWYYDPDPYVANAARHKRVPQRETTVVLFGTGLRPAQPADVEVVEVADGVTLAYFLAEPGTVLDFRGTRFGVRDLTSR